MRAFASEILTVTNTPVEPSANVLAGQPALQRASFVVEGAPIRITLDGSTPSVSAGMLFQPGDFVTIEDDEDVRGFKAIRTTAANASLYVTYFK